MTMCWGSWLASFALIQRHSTLSRYSIEFREWLEGGGTRRTLPPHQTTNFFNFSTSILMLGGGSTSGM